MLLILRSLQLIIILGLCNSLIANNLSLADSPSHCTLSTTHIKNISSLLEPIIVQYNIPGMVAAIISSDQVIAAGAVGVRSHLFPNKVSIQDKFHIGSDSKAMTATLLALLVDKGLLKWNTKVLEIFPELKGKINPKYDNLNLEQLLSHRGGVVSEDIDYEKIQKLAGGDLVKERQMAMEQALVQPPKVAQGEYLYSNSGYIIAGHMAEKVTGSTWEDLIYNQLLLPLKMESAGFGPPGNKASDQPIGHDETGRSIENDIFADNPPMIGPAGRIHMAILDWAKFIMLHLRGARGNSCLLTQSSFEKLQSPISNPPPPYAMGWMVAESEWAAGKVLSHAGSNGFWFAKVWIAPNRDLAILVACNKGGKEALAACDKAGLILMQTQLHLTHVSSIDPPL